ncbi:BTAD domain-containing putative transcriptional regulator [Streptomyces sp. NPDC048290]|uniref:AfsR/SARP family transcriptional regulator n=1 Tax=Streptomyces sp. NPDC048290 TaxID=3155811 RepID=UPI00342232B5
MRLTLLGPVELRDARDTAITMPSGKRLAVLALLALRLNETVSVGQFFDLVWDGDAPPQARAALQGHVAGLRKALEGAPLQIVTAPGGYRLEGAPDDVDVHAFTRLAAEGTGHGDDGTAADILRTALDHWRGEPLLGVPDGELLRVWRPELEERHLAATQEWAARLLALGRGAEAVSALETASGAEDHREREPLAALLMRCLHQAGRRTEALEVYDTARRWLRTELGVIPGADLQSAFTAVMEEDAQEAEKAEEAEEGGEAGEAGKPGEGEEAAAVEAHIAPPGAPTATAGAPESPALSRCHLPLLPHGLVGRQTDTEWLERECGPDADGAGVALVTGPAGVGKTALALRWAHSATDAFPDGQLFVDLRGFDTDGRISAHDALGGFLRALGMSDWDIPTTERERQDAYTELTERRRVLVVLDNASSEDTVRPLLPAGAGCATVVTSRVMLDDFVIHDGAAVRSLAPLPEPEALSLVAAMAGADRCARERAEVRRLIALCDRLPLALRIVGARLSTNPEWSIGDVVGELEDERFRLQSLATTGAASVPSALKGSCSRLTPQAARLLTLLALHPGTDTDRYTASALLDSGPEEAQAAVAMLASHHLVAETRPSRYGRHDLVRLYSEGLLAELPGTLRDEARDRLVDYLLAATAHAVSFNHMADERLNGPHEWQPHALPLLSDGDEAWEWFCAESHTVLSLIRNPRVDPVRAWQLADNTINIHLDRAPLPAHMTFAEAGLARAEECGDGYGQSRMLFIRGTATRILVGPAEGLEFLERALGVVQGLPLSLQHVRVRLGVGWCRLTLGDLAAAQDQLRAAIEDAAQLGNRYAQALATTDLAHLLLKDGDPHGAVRAAREARALLPGSTALTVVMSLLNEADALWALGDLEAAEPCLLEVIERSRAMHDLPYWLAAERDYARLLEAAGRPDEARAHRSFADTLANSSSVMDYLEAFRYSPAVSACSRERPVPTDPGLPE